MPELNDLITAADNVLSVLEGLLGADSAETPIPDPSVSYPIPAIAYDSVNDDWTLTQTAADTDGLYKGIFMLAISTRCAKLTVVSHDVVTPDDGVPARYKVCGAGSFTNVSAMTTLNNKEIVALEIRSKQPFTVKIKLVAVWCYEFDFTVSNGGFAPWVSGSGSYASGVGWNSANYTYNSVQYTATSIGRALPEFTATKITMEYTITPGNQNYAGILPRNNGSNLTPSQTSSASGSSSITWTGNQVMDQIRLDVSANANGFAGSSRITKLRLSGMGVNPFGEDNCVP